MPCRQTGLLQTGRAEVHLRRVARHSIEAPTPSDAPTTDAIGLNSNGRRGDRRESKAANGLLGVLSRQLAEARNDGCVDKIVRLHSSE